MDSFSSLAVLCIAGLTYGDHDNSQNAVRHDIDLMKTYFISLGCAIHHIFFIVLDDEEFIKLDVLKTMESFLCNKSRDLIIYYAGHGCDGYYNYTESNALYTRIKDLSRPLSDIVREFKNENPNVYIKQNRGAWPTFDNEFITFSDVCRLWDSRKGPMQRNKRLYIIIDACFSGSWVSQLKRSKGQQIHRDILIQSSSDGRKGSEGEDSGYFTQHWLNLQSSSSQLESSVTHNFRLFSLFHLRDFKQHGHIAIFKTITSPNLLFMNVGINSKLPSISINQLTMSDFLR